MVICYKNVKKKFKKKHHMGTVAGMFPIKYWEFIRHKALFYNKK